MPTEAVSTFADAAAQDQKSTCSRTRRVVSLDVEDVLDVKDVYLTMKMPHLVKFNCQFLLPGS